MTALEEILPIRSLIFVQDSKEPTDEILIPRALLERWMDQYPSGSPLLATLTNIETEQIMTVCIGGSQPDRTVYAPSWIMNQICTTTDDLVSLQPLLEVPVSATKLVLKPLDALAQDMDFRSIVESYLDMFHVLQMGTTLTIPVKDLGDYEISVFVESTEPAPVVRLGGEVEFEFVGTNQPSDSSASASASSVEIPSTEVNEELPCTTENEIVQENNTVVEDSVVTIPDYRERMRLAWLKRSQILQQQGQSPADTALQTSEATSKSSGMA